MLQGRIAPPSSPAVDAASGRPPLPLSRRNSFSRDMAAAIAPTRAAIPVNDAQHIQLLVGETLRPLSPRKSASFSLPRSPRQDDAPSAADAARTLRPTLSDFQLRRLLDGDNNHGAMVQPFRSTPSASATGADLQTVDSPTKSVASGDGDDASSATSSSYSCASPTKEGCDDEDDDDDDSHTDEGHVDDSDGDAVVDDPDAFEAWLQDARVLESPTPVVKHETLQKMSSSSSPDLAARLLHDRAAASALELSKSVQQIEHEIRLAIDAAASRVATNADRSEVFSRELQDHGIVTTSEGFPELAQQQQPVEATSAAPVPPVETERELLLLMDVLIGDGRSETIEIYAGDKPEELAAAFAAAHGLVADAVPRLTQHIQDQLAALDNEGRGDEEEEEAVSAQQLHYGDHTKGLGNAGAGYGGGMSAHHFEGDEDFQDDRSAFGESEAERHDDEIAGHFATEQRASLSDPPRPQREYEREYSYNHLLEKYGHYTSHSNRVIPTTQRTGSNSKDSGLTVAHRRQNEESSGDPLTMRNVELSEHARLTFTPRPVAAFASSRPHSKDKESVYSRLYALAEAREKWIRRQQKVKAADEVRERQAMMKLEISAKSRDMVAGRGSGGYAHIGERLYDEALSDLAKKQREREKRELERAQQVDWTCPKCAYVNQHGDAVCKNVVASVTLPPPAPLTCVRRETLSPAALLDAHPEVVCGHARPEELFRPTLLVAPASVARAVRDNKTRATASSASSQRQRTQQQMEDEFRQTCPFKPKINEVSEEIMRDKLEQEAKAAGGRVTTAGGDVRRKNPHQALYEDAFHARAQREAREEAHLRQFPFKPNIGVNALWSKHTGEDEDVVERLAVSKYQELERKRESLHAKYAPDRDPDTGREYFKPETGRAPIFNRNERGLPIGDFLYEAHREQEEYKRRLRQQEDEQRRQRREQRFVSDKSKQVLEARKKKTFARLFAWLVKAQQQVAPDESSAQNPEPRMVPTAVELGALPQEVARIMSIVFEFANHKPIAFGEFEQLMDKLMADVPGLTLTQVLSLTDSLHDGKSARRGTLDREDTPDDPELTFRPAIDKNSDALAKKHGRSDRPSVFEALNQYYDHYKERQAQAKKQREREFARTHPFQPTFYTKDRKAKATKFYEKLHHQEMTTTIATGVAGGSVKDAAPSLRTAVPNARPFVRPLGRTPSDQTLRSRCSSVAGEDDDAALTSHVLAALDDGVPSLPTAPISSSASSAPSAAASGPHGSAFSALFSTASAHADRLSLDDLSR